MDQAGRGVQPQRLKRSRSLIGIRITDETHSQNLVPTVPESYRKWQHPRNIFSV